MKGRGHRRHGRKGEKRKERRRGSRTVKYTRGGDQFRWVSDNIGYLTLKAQGKLQSLGSN